MLNKLRSLAANQLVELANRADAHRSPTPAARQAERSGPGPLPDLRNKQDRNRRQLLFNGISKAGHAANSNIKKAASALLARVEQIAHRASDASTHSSPAPRISPFEPGMARLQDLTARHDGAIRTLDTIPNFFTSAPGTRIECRHLVEQWLENESVMTDVSRARKHIDAAKAAVLQQRFATDFVDASASKQLVHDSEFGRWLQDFCHALPDDVTDFPVRLTNPGHRMGMKVSTLRLETGEKAVSLKMYDPDMAKTISCGPLAAQELGGLQLADFFPKYRQGANNAGFTVGHAAGILNAPARQYFTPTVDFPIMRDTFAASAEIAGATLFQELADRLMQDPQPSRTRAIMMNLIKDGKKSPLIAVAEGGYNPQVFRRCVELMQHAGMTEADAENFLSRTVRPNGRMPLASIVFENHDLQPMADYLQALAALGIGHGGCVRLLDQPDASGIRPMHLLASNLTAEKADLFFTWAKSHLTPAELMQLFASESGTSITPLQIALLGNGSLPRLPAVLLGHLASCGLTSAQIHSMLAKPASNGDSVFAAFDAGHGKESQAVVRDWLSRQARPVRKPQARQVGMPITSPGRLGSRQAQQEGPATAASAPGRRPGPQAHRS
ncbi:MAG: hypothetical protein ACRYGK_17295 [Janthinobacterium lividum]